jgi:hypothetical protein
MPPVPIPRAPSPTAALPWVLALVLGAGAHVLFYRTAEPPRCDVAIAPIPAPVPMVVAARAPADAPPVAVEHVTVERALLAAALESPRSVAGGARIIPAVKDGRPIGMKLYGLRKGSIARELGFENGDVIRAVDGVMLDSVDTAMALYGRVRHARRFAVEYRRNGETRIKAVLVL